MNFYKHYLGDYARDTKGLSLIEHGAYRVLLDHVYATEERLPDDLMELYRIAGAMTPAERKAVDKVAQRFFPVNGDGRRYNKRAEEEIQKHSGQVQANRLVAEERERKRKEQRSLLESIDEPSTNRSTNDSPNHSQKPEESKASAEGKAPSAEGRGAAAPDCPHEQVIALYHELLPANPKVLEWTTARQQMLRARWREKAKRTAKQRGYETLEQGLAWWRRFLTYVGESKFLTGQTHGRDGRPPFVATLEWLLKPANFAKVIEGNYHRDSEETR